MDRKNAQNLYNFVIACLNDMGIYDPYEYLQDAKKYYYNKSSKAYEAWMYALDSEYQFNRDQITWEEHVDNVHDFFWRWIDLSDRLENLK